MNRRESLKALGLGTLTTGLLLEACKPKGNKLADDTNDKGTEENAGRLPEEIERNKKLNATRFFNTHEMSTITVLVDIIIPKDEKSGSASDAKVPEFIEFIVKDMPEYQTPLRGGLRWLDLKCLNLYNKTFIESSAEQQIEIITEIAYPAKAKPEMKQGVNFFNQMRNLTATGFFTSKIGIEDLGYVGNAPNVWNGVPEDVLKHYGMEGV